MIMKAKLTPFLILLILLSSCQSSNNPSGIYEFQRQEVGNIRYNLKLEIKGDKIKIIREIYAIREVYWEKVPSYDPAAQNHLQARDRWTPYSDVVECVGIIVKDSTKDKFNFYSINITDENCFINKKEELLLLSYNIEQKKVFFQFINPKQQKRQLEILRIADSISRADNSIKYKQNKAAQRPLGNDENEIKKTELSPVAQGSSTSNTWIVILGSYKNRTEAVNSQMQLLTKYQLQTEVLNTNSFQKLTKNLFIVVGGKNLTNAEAKQKLKKIKGYKIDGYIKDAGLTD